MPKSARQSKYWVFTWNNPNTEYDMPEAWKGVQYGCYQLERGASGTPHYQGYVVFKTKQRMSALKKLAPVVHWEARLGTHAQAKAYSLKDDDTYMGHRIEWGSDKDVPQDDSERGKRNDLVEIKQKLDRGISLQEIAQDEKHFSSWVRYHKSFASYQTMLKPPRTWKTKVYVLWGPTGSGKTSWVYRMWDLANIYRVPKSNSKNTWFDGFQSQPVVVFDDYYANVRYSLMLELLDRYPVLGEAKGTFVNFNPEVIVLTSNKHPKDWYKSLTDEQYAALERRFDVVAKVDPGVDWKHPVFTYEKGTLPTIVDSDSGDEPVPTQQEDPHPLEIPEPYDSDGSETF